ncbi:MAG: hydrolase [Phycisphaerae bacterium]|nr:hydrolase [Phycisphaerae bacterium]
MEHPDKLSTKDALLFVIDLQEKLLPAIHDADAVTEACRLMIRAAGVFELPMLLTEQYPKGLGPTVPPIMELLEPAGVKPIEKVLFTGYTPEVRQALQSASRNQIVVVGIESHVCVQQTVLDLLRVDYKVWVCADAVGSRKPHDRDVSLDRMRQAGAFVTTTESVIFELTRQAGTDLFKKVLKIIK